MPGANWIEDKNIHILASRSNFLRKCDFHAFAFRFMRKNRAKGDFDNRKGRDYARFNRWRRGIERAKIR